MKLVDAEGKEAGVGQPGEIWVRGANVTPGYWRRPELNATAFTDGWFRTGDVAVRDADGFYTIVDRIKDMFISGGENVYPAEIEATIVELDAVGDVAVIGIPDAQWGEVGCAFVVVAAGQVAGRGHARWRTASAGSRNSRCRSGSRSWRRCRARRREKCRSISCARNGLPDSPSRDGSGPLFRR